jgi:hypothetical protein
VTSSLNVEDLPLWKLAVILGALFFDSRADKILGISIQLDLFFLCFFIFIVDDYSCPLACKFGLLFFESEFLLDRNLQF